jgi:hypothetical protein
MQSHNTLQQYAQAARLERTLYLADLTSSAIVATSNAITFVADVVLSAHRAKNPDRIFTFEA